MAVSTKHDYDKLTKRAKQDEWYGLEQNYPQLKEMRLSGKGAEDIYGAILRNPQLEVDPHEAADLFYDAFVREVKNEDKKTERDHDKGKRHDDEEYYYHTPTEGEQEESKREEEMSKRESIDKTAEVKLDSEEKKREVTESGGKREDFTPETISGMKTVAKNGDDGSGRQSEGKKGELREDGSESKARGDEFDRSQLDHKSRQKLEGLEKQVYKEMLRRTEPIYSRGSQSGARLATPINPPPPLEHRQRAARMKHQEEGKDDGMQIPGLGRIGGKLARRGLGRMLGKQLTSRLAMMAARLTVSTPHGMLITAIVVVVLFLLVTIAYLFFKTSPYEFSDEPVTEPLPVPGEDAGGTSPIPGLTLFLPEVAPVPAGEKITIPIRVTYSGNEEIEVLASVPEGARFVSATGGYELFTNLIVWRLSANTPTLTEEGGGGMSQSKIELYRSYGFPAPDNPQEMSAAQRLRWEKYYRPHALVVAGILNVDLGLIGMWPWLENGFQAYMDNCLDSEFNPNTYCDSWGGNWQVGYGNHPAYEGVARVTEAMRAMHPGRSAKEVGDQVIADSYIEEKYNPSGLIPYIPITNPSEFPNKSVEEIAAGADVGNVEDRRLLGVLLKDDAIAAYLIGTKFKGYVDGNDQLSVAQRMAGWSATYYSPQKIINYIAGIYNERVTTREYEFSFTIEPADGDNLTVPGYTVSGRVVGGDGDGIDF